MQFKASASGSLMLLGEYGVLSGQHALACAVDKRIIVTLTPREDDRIKIKSTLHGNYETTLSQIKPDRPFHFVLSVLQYCQSKMKSGCDIHIVSEFSDKVGFGSSAAVTVATLSALTTWLQIEMSPLEFIRQGRECVRQVQGVGSGTDIAASVLGGIVGYRAQPLFAEKYAQIYPLTAFYAGYKTPTVDAIKQVQDYFAAYPVLFNSICQTLGQCALEGMQAVQKGDWVTFGKIMNIQQGMMESLGVSSTLLQEMIKEIRISSTILGAKISGAGLGDCVIGLGTLSASLSKILLEEGVQYLPVAMTLQGVSCEKI